MRRIRSALAILAVVAGFLAPILASSGHGDHVVLFGYYAVLNAMIFFVAWLRPWRALNVLGFVFTFGIGTAWGVLKYRPDMFATTEPFLLLFFAFYLCIPVFYARRREFSQRDLIDSTLVFGMPLAAFPLQAALLDGARMPLAWSALGARRRSTSRWPRSNCASSVCSLLGLSHALLALGFATLAVPLALSARATACTWALEGAALVWLGLRQQRKLPRWIGYAMQGAAGLAFAYGFDIPTDPTPILNGQFFSAMLIAIGGGVTAWLLFRVRPQGATHHRVPAVDVGLVVARLRARHRTLRTAASRDRFRAARHRDHRCVRRVRVPASGLARSRVARLRRDSSAAVPLVLLTAIDNGGPLERWAAAAWLAWFVSMLFALRAFAVRGHPQLDIAQASFVWIVDLCVGAELACAAERHLQLGPLWIVLGGLMPTALLFWLTLRRNALVRWPDAAAAEKRRYLSLCAAAAILALPGSQDCSSMAIRRR